MQKKSVICMLLSAVVSIFFTMSPFAFAADKVVVIPFGGAVGNATAADVVQGKTFSSQTGKGLTGTLDLPPTMQTYTTPTYGMTFNLIPAGTFTMGSPADEPGGPYADETQHQVTLTESYYMQTTEITQQQWRDVVLAAEAAGYLAIGVLDETPSQSNQGAYNPNYPVEWVFWNDIRDWLNALNMLTGKNYALPTEAQWEYAARATTTTAWAYLHSYDTSPTGTMIGPGFNSNLTAMGWYIENNTSDYPNNDFLLTYNSKPVAKKQPNKWGLYDMHGNVPEWCQDWAEENYYTDPDSGVDPQGPATGVSHVIRGGACYSSAEDARSANRIYGIHIITPGHICDLGFRIVLPPDQ